MTLKFCCKPIQNHDGSEPLSNITYDIVRTNALNRYFSVCEPRSQAGPHFTRLHLSLWHSVTFVLDHRLGVTAIGDLGAFHARRKADVAGYRACHDDGISRSLVQRDEKMSNTGRDTYRKPIPPAEPHGS